MIPDPNQSLRDEMQGASAEFSNFIQLMEKSLTASIRDTDIVGLRFALSDVRETIARWVKVLK